MNLADLEKTFWGDQREQPTRVRLSRVVRALREDIIPERMRITRANDTCSRASLRRYFNEILGGLDAEGEAAGGPVRKEGTEAIAADPGARGTTPAAAQAHEWQPIETAPKDGRQVLLSGMNYSQPWVWQGWFDHEDERGWFAAGSHWTDADDGRLETPTHWMPLPPPPQEET